jgi:hypothetical protein
MIEQAGSVKLFRERLESVEHTKPVERFWRLLVANMMKPQKEYQKLPINLVNCNLHLMHFTGMLIVKNLARFKYCYKEGIIR